MYEIYAYTDPPNHPNVGIYGIHGVSLCLQFLGDTPKAGMVGSHPSCNSAARLARLRCHSYFSDLTSSQLTVECSGTKCHQHGNQKPDEKTAKSKILTLCTTFSTCDLPGLAASALGGRHGVLLAIGGRRGDPEHGGLARSTEEGGSEQASKPQCSVFPPEDHLDPDPSIPILPTPPPKGHLELYSSKNTGLSDPAPCLFRFASPSAAAFVLQVPP